MATTAITSDAEHLAAAFHETYERLAPAHGYKTREASVVPWAEVPDNNRNLMIAVARDLLDTATVTLAADQYLALAAAALTEASKRVLLDAEAAIALTKVAHGWHEHAALTAGINEFQGQPA